MPRRLIIISCGKGKIWDRQPDHGECPAHDAYVGPFFTVNRRYAEHFAPSDWMILSARFGLLLPDTPIPPYNVSFKEPSPDVIGPDQLRVGAIQLKVPEYDEIEVLAGMEYVERLLVALRGFDVTLILPYASCGGNGEMMGRATAAVAAGLPMDMLHDGLETRLIKVADMAPQPTAPAPAPAAWSTNPPRQRGRTNKANDPGFINRAFELHENEGLKQGDAIAQAAREFGIELSRSYHDQPGVRFHHWRKMGYGSKPARPMSPPRPVPTRPPEPVTERTKSLVARLIEVGESIGADELIFVNDCRVGEILKDNPFAFLLAASVDRGMVAENAWRLPGRIKAVLGHLDPARIAGMSSDEMLATLGKIEGGRPRYLTAAAKTIVEVAEHVVHQYGGDAANLWSNQPAATIKRRLERIYGVGPGIAATVIILLDRLGILTLQPADYAQMDPKADVHVKRVFARLGFCGSDPSEQEAIMAARRLNPEYPGKLDSPAWHIGRTWCHADRPACNDCPMGKECPRLS